MSDFLERIAKLPPERLALLAAELQNRLDAAERRLAQRSEPIAIVGMGCRFPGGADDPDRYWQLLRDGVDAVREVPAERWDARALLDPDATAPGKMVTCRGGFLDTVDGFDARFFGIAPREAVSVDPQHRLLLEVTWEALEDAGIAADRLDGVTGGVFIGLCNKDYAQLMLERPLETIDAYSAAGGAGSMAAGRIAYLLGLRGPAVTIDTACSSSLVALHLACESLRSGECRLAISGGANLILSVETMIALSKAQMLSPDGRCSTFDESANGIVRGEGCGVIVLKRLSDAIADGDRIHALIRATAINQDGRSSGITAPNGAAQEALMRAALERGGLTAADVDYIEAHGTGTRLGDPIEVRALGAVYGSREHGRPLRIGSVKTNLGHLEAAAGIAGVLKAVLALRAAEIPPHLHLEKPNPLIEWTRWPIEVTTKLSPWEPRTRDGVRRAAVSSFGFSGTNAHAILEEAPSREPPREHDSRAHLLPLSARSESALRLLASRYAEAFSKAADGRWADFCHTAAAGRARFAYRLGVVARSPAEAAAALAAWTRQEPAPGVVAGGPASTAMEPAFLFTGQGAQYVDMGRELYETGGAFRQAFDACDEILRGELDVPLVDVVFPAPAARARAESLIDETRYAQPAIFALEYALAQLWRSWGIEPVAVAGHSVGEFAAAVVAGVLSLEDALRLVAARGRLMQALPAGGAMAAVFADSMVVESRLDEGSSVVIASYNSPGNTVVSGPEADVLTFLDRLAESGIQGRRLAVSHAFHSPLVEPMLAELEAAARRATFRPPEISFFSTATGGLLDASTICSPSYWREQARVAVRFADAVRAMRAAGHELFLEVGPHATLCGLGAQVLDGRAATFVPSLRRGQSERQCVLSALAELHVRGIEPEWRHVIDVPDVRKVRLPTYPFERQRYWIGWSARAHGSTTDTTAVPATATGPTAGLLWTRTWECLLPSVETMPAAAPLADLVARRTPELVAEHDGNVYSASLPRLDALCAAYVANAFRALGVGFARGEVWSEQELCRLASVLPAHERLFHRLHEILAEEGVIAAGPSDEWRVVSEPAQADASAMLAKLLEDFPAVAVEAEMTARCGERLAEALTGKIDPMDLLFPGGSLEATERLYAETPSFRIFNTLVAETVADAARLHAEARHTPRILEIGAGTGGTTSKVLPLLADTGVRYVFTDVSPLFLERARAKLADYGCVDYRLLDIGRDPAEQGYEDASFDIVVASNVLHATPDLGRTLEHVRRLLAPGGLLVLLEGVREQRFGDLTVGMTDGWWCFTDTEVRPRYPLLSRSGWVNQLERHGFEQVRAASPAGDDERDVLSQQAVILAVAPERPRHVRQTSASRRTWVALARPDALSGQAARALRAAGIPLEILDPFAADEFDADSPSAYAALLQRLSESAPPCVLHLLSLDVSVDPQDDGAKVLAAQRGHLTAALRLVQGAVTSGRGELVLVTRAAQPLGGEAVDPSGCALWGLRRTVAAEYPEIRCRAVDLPSEWTDAVPAVAAWLDEDPEPLEEEIAVRPGGIFAARIVPHATPATGSLAIRSDGSYIVTGGLAGLGLRVAEWLTERGAGRVVLCGRSDPSPASLDAFERMRALGADVRVVRGDVADPACVRALVEAAGAGLRGVFHSAGVTSDAVLLNQDWSHFADVMQAKVAGAWNLHVATRDHAIEHFVLFSSGAAFLGSSGQANHAAANAFLAGLAWHRRAAGLPGLAIDWGAWTEVGAATRGEVLERARAAGLGAIDPETGLRLLEHSMTGSDAHVAAIAVDWPAYFERHPGFAERGLFSALSVNLPRASHVSADTVDRPAGALAREVMEAVPSSRRRILLDGIHAEAARVLALRTSEEIDPTVPLTELGLDSLMAVELRNALAAKLDRTLPATLLFTYPTLSELADHLMEQLESDEPAASEQRAGVDGQPLETLEEHELEKLLESKLDVSEAPR